MMKLLSPTVASIIKLFSGLLLIASAFLAGCNGYSPSVSAPSNSETVNTNSRLEYFTLKSDGDIVAQDGTEYAFLANEGFLQLLGKKKLIGKIRGEANSIGYGFELGLYACEQDADRVMLLRYLPDSEWGMFYRKKTAPRLDISGTNFVRLEFVGYEEMSELNMYSAGAEHITCNDGMTGKHDIAAFLHNIVSGKTAEAAGLYQLIEGEDGMLRNCYEMGTVYGFFAGENAAAIPYKVQSFDNHAYSITINNIEYVLPKEYLVKLGFGK